MKAIEIPRRLFEEFSAESGAQYDSVELDLPFIPVLDPIQGSYKINLTEPSIARTNNGFGFVLSEVRQPDWAASSLFVLGDMEEELESACGHFIGFEGLNSSLRGSDVVPGFQRYLIVDGIQRVHPEKRQKIGPLLSRMGLRAANLELS